MRRVFHAMAFIVDGDCPAIFQDIKSVWLSKSHEEKTTGWWFQTFFNYILGISIDQ